MRRVQHCPHFFINILTFPLFVPPSYFTNNGVYPFVRSVLILFIFYNKMPTSTLSFGDGRICQFVSTSMLFNSEIRQCDIRIYGVSNYFF